MISMIQAWGAIRATLKEAFNFSEIKTILGLAGLDLSIVSHLEQEQNGGASKGKLLSKVDMAFGEMSEDGQKQFTTLLSEEILSRKPESERQLENDLSRLGWTIIRGRLLPVQLFDRDDVKDISEMPLLEMVKAAQRFRDGDLSGAISAACGAVDTVTSKVYMEKNIGDPGIASFQERCRKSFDAVAVDASLQKELLEIGWSQSNATIFKGSSSYSL